MKSAREPGREFLEQTLKIWQAYAAEQLTSDDARVICENIVALFSLLKEWEDETGADDGSQ